jgi:EF hand
MKTFISAAALALFVATVVPALAQDNSGQNDTMQMADRGNGEGHGNGRGHGEGHRGGHGKGGRHMQMIDANGDGVVGDDEAATLADHAFNRIDSDGSGDVSVDEFSTVRGGGHGWRNWFGSGAQNDAAVAGLKVKFATLDADKDGKLTKVEFLADAKTRFTAADTDKDGKVSPWEFRAQN